MGISPAVSPYFPPVGVKKRKSKTLHSITTHDAISQRALGAYYTPSSAADFVAEWAVRNDGEHIIEPSFGDGSFLRAIAKVAECKKLLGLHLTGIEINSGALAEAPQLDALQDVKLCHDDFLSFPPIATQAIIANPPYVRLRKLPEDQRLRGMATTRAVGHEMDPAGSVWMPFVIHAARFLTPGGRMAFVLPYDFTYVRYARPLWAYLGRNFGSLRIIRTHERLFADIYQEVVLLLADDFGGSCTTVSFEAYEKVSDLLALRPSIEEALSLDDIVRGKRVFLEALLTPALRHLLADRLTEQLAPAREQLTFNIGYVTGDKDFFHPKPHEIEAYTIPTTSLRPAIITARMLKGVGLNTSGLASSGATALFLPPADALTSGEQEYVLHGEKQGVSKRYKCQIRQPWYVVPGVKVPDLILSVFSERPLLLRNDAEYVASNSLLCGYCAPGTRDALITAWYTSLTLLQIELEVHALGGGVMVMVPGEAGNIRLPRPVQASPKHIKALDKYLLEGQSEAAYALGDVAVLKAQLNLTNEEVNLVREGVRTLAHWRTSSRATVTE